MSFPGPEVPGERREPAESGSSGGDTSGVGPKKIAAPYPEPMGAAAYGQNGLTGNTQGYMGNPGVLRINDSPIGGSMNGVYKFNSPFQILDYGSGSIKFTANSTTTTLTSSEKVSIGTGSHFAGYFMSVAPSGSSPIDTGVSATLSVTGLSGGGGPFNSFDTDFTNVIGPKQVGDTSSASISVRWGVRPGYPLTITASNGHPKRFVVLPKNDTSFTVNFGLNVPTSTLTNVRAQAKWFTINGFQSPAETLRSF